MRAERIELLARALESGRFKQGTGRLKISRGDEEFFCCLGVACEIYRQESGVGYWSASGMFVTPKDGSALHIPTDVFEWYGFQEQNIEIEVNGITGDAAAYNDHGASFVQIAEGFRRLAVRPESKLE
jgi:hypothetical protein